MNTINVNAEVLEKIFNQEEVPVIALKEFKIDTYVKRHHVYKALWTPGIEANLNT